PPLFPYTPLFRSIAPPSGGIQSGPEHHRPGDKRGAALTAKSGGGLDGPEGCNFHQRSRSGSGLFARLAQVGDDTKRAFGLAGLADVAPVQNRSEEHRVGKGGGWGWAGGQ